MDAIEKLKQELALRQERADQAPLTGKDHSFRQGLLHGLELAIEILEEGVAQPGS